ncbi:gyrase subunit A [Seminavis robusta]|uniref:DNA topoisomerase (ATP-hydrolyzing) n=1 Tax=Seminavis robusta TaxID=568900 RepID=A0A9N8DKZ8_9STRA|nr:gyrase subunit A [Seminavis robusta]|eukprot:Sro137_g064520.1 gyrase subunit A (959) ;mRNA; f:88102-91146
MTVLFCFLLISVPISHGFTWMAPVRKSLLLTHRSQVPSAFLPTNPATHSRRRDLSTLCLWTTKSRRQYTLCLRASASGGSVEEQVDPDNDVTASALLLSDFENNNNNGHNNIELQTEISRSFLQYSLSIILGRALPDARDGLKPVHRRILFAMSQLGLNASGPHRKCARVVGEVLGKWHPHGDQAVYDALVRMAQLFSSYHPLIDGHGNFGSVDNDPAAAMRYTECRISPLAQTALLENLHPSIVPFLPNFDGTDAEPTVLPSQLPLLLLNGSSGIAVGMATNIPPHNLNEVMAACHELLEARMGKRDAVTDEELWTLIPAPDFPTGALLLQSNQGAQQFYEKGQGGIVLRAVTAVEQIVSAKKTQRTAIIVTELPYQTNKAALLEKIAMLCNDKKLEGIADLRDESDREGIRIVIELKRDAVAAVVLNNLFKKTALQSTFSGNFVALLAKNINNNNKNTSGGNRMDATTTALVPQRLTLRIALDCFLDFRFETIRNKSQMELDAVTARQHIVEGLLLALAQLDAVIDTIRQAPDTATAKTSLQDLLEASVEQAEAILRLQLGQLTRLNKDKLENELEDLIQQAKRLTTLLEKDTAVYKLIQKESQQLVKKFGTERKSRIVTEDDGALNDIDLIRNSRSVIVVTRGGYIKRMPLKVFESQNRGTRGKRGTSDGGESEDNAIAHCFTCNDHDTLLMVTQSGIAFGLRAYQVPTGSRTAKGQPIPSVLPIRNSDVITAILPVSQFSHNRFLVLATEKGWIKKTPLAAFENLTGRGLTIASLDEDDRLNWCQLCQDGDDILIGSAMGSAIRFEISKLRPTGRTSRGVRSMKLREGDAVADMNVLSGSESKARKEECVLAITSNGFGKRVATSEFRPQGRGGLGVIAIKFKSEDDRMSCLHVVKDDDEVLVVTAKGIIVRQNVSAISTQGRSATGVRVQRTDEGDTISSVSIVPKYEETDNA